MKVCLIGNNLTSLILAYILSNKNFNIEIYGLKSTKHVFSTRTLGITASNLKYLEKYLNNLSRKTYSIDEIKVLIQNGKINEEILFNQNSINLFKKCNSYYETKDVPTTVIYFDEVRRGKSKEKVGIFN